MTNLTQKPQPSFIEIPEDFDMQRIDNFLFNQFKRVPKSHIYKLLRSGEVRVNKKRVAPNYKLQVDDVLRLPPLWQDIAVTPQSSGPSSRVMELLKSRIIYEDAGLLVINKPSGIASHGGSGINFGAIEILRHARPDIRNLELIHRLDRDTSGCLLLAKKRSMLRTVHEILRNGAMRKRYMALLRGCWESGERRVEAALSKTHVLSGERVVKVDIDGKMAVSIFRPQHIFANTSLVEIELLTGRTHQIRVHAAHIGHPIAGDEKYGERLFNQQMKAQGLNRMFLHAKHLRFQLPDGKVIEVTAELDVDLERLINGLL